MHKRKKSVARLVFLTVASAEVCVLGLCVSLSYLMADAPEHLQF